MPATEPRPKDAAGDYIAGDSADITDAHYLIRGVSKSGLSSDILEEEYDDEELKISAKFFNKSSRPPTAGMSVDVKEFIEEAGIDPEQKWRNQPNFPCSLLLRVGDVRNLGFVVGYTPIAENDFHADVWWPHGKNFPRGKRRELAENAKWFIPPPR